MVRRDYLWESGGKIRRESPGAPEWFLQKGVLNLVFSEMHIVLGVGEFKDYLFILELKRKLKQTSDGYT